MDPIVLQALQKWPDLPFCYGWLKLDARGNWRMRDEYAQQHQLPGETIRHTALINFINRNYAVDTKGAWYFQNGPQRVYVELELTPYIVHTDSAQQFILHTGQTMAPIDQVMLTDTGRLLFITAEQVAAVDDRDLTSCLKNLCMDDKPVQDEQLLTWLSTPTPSTHLMWQDSHTHHVVTRIETANIASHFGFNPHPSNAI